MAYRIIPRVKEARILREKGKMNKKQLPLLILALFSTIHLITASHLADATQGNIGNNLEEYLKTYNISFLVRADLNNDGKEERITIYRQWDGENPNWSDDQWYILCIFDDEGNVLYMKDVSYFQEVGSFIVKDQDGDGLKEVIISLEQVQCWDAKTQTYQWKDDGYELVPSAAVETEGV